MASRVNILALSIRLHVTRVLVITSSVLIGWAGRSAITIRALFSVLSILLLLASLLICGHVAFVIKSKISIVNFLVAVEFFYDWLINLLTTLSMFHFDFPIIKWSWLVHLTNCSLCISWVSKQNISKSSGLLSHMVLYDLNVQNRSKAREYLPQLVFTNLFGNACNINITVLFIVLLNVFYWVFILLRLLRFLFLLDVWIRFQFMQVLFYHFGDRVLSRGLLVSFLLLGQLLLNLFLYFFSV